MGDETDYAPHLPQLGVDAVCLVCGLPARHPDAQHTTDAHQQGC